MKQGLTPRFTRKTDWDFFKNHPQYGAVAPTVYEAFDVDRKFPQFNQNAMGLPYGCTGMAQSYLCTSEDGIIADPKEIYDNTPPFGETQGRDIRDSLKRICTVGYRRYVTTEAPAHPRSGYYNVRSTAPLDWFDAIYVSLYSTKERGRAASIGIPWFPEFEASNSLGIVHLPVVIPTELLVGGFFGTLVFLVKRLFGGLYSWHNAAISGLALINGDPHLRVWSWQGDSFGLNGAIYLNREDTNKLFDLYMTDVFIASEEGSAANHTIDTDIVETIVNFMLHL